MLHFDSDYLEGAHPAIIERLVATNFDQTPGYGVDAVCESARARIRFACQAPQAAVHFLVGGTQANAAVIDQLLRPWEGVVSADTGHINGHEGGAIEMGGHKVLTIAPHDGKMVAEELDKYITDTLTAPSWDHAVIPAMVYISQATETGSVYTLAELEAISAVCRRHKMPLFIDGARLGYALASEGADMTLKDIARLADVFYIGGTKVGALLGEAVVFTNTALSKNFFTIMKQGGAVLAKGRLLGIQFDTLFTDNLYFEISRHAVAMAMKLKEAFKAKGYRFYSESPSNQQFVILENEKLAEIEKSVQVSHWCKVDDKHMAVRFCTSWATTEETIDRVIELL